MVLLRWVRIVTYSLASLFSFSFGLRLISLKNRLAYGFAAVLFATAVTSGLGGLLVFWWVVLDTVPPWQEAATTTIALLQLVAPIVLYWLFHKTNNRE